MNLQSRTHHCCGLGSADLGFGGRCMQSRRGDDTLWCFRGDYSTHVVNILFVTAFCCTRLRDNVCRCGLASVGGAFWCALLLP